MNPNPCDLSRRSFLASGALGLAGLLVGHRPWLTALLTDELERRLKEDMARHHIPGLAVCVVKGDRIVWSKAFGFSDLEAQIPMSPTDSIQNIGSISKTITATAVMQLVEQGRISLSEDVNAYLDFSVRNHRFPDVPITCRHLLTHRSSIKDGPAYGMSYMCGDPTLSLIDWLRSYLTEGGEHFDPEQNFHTWKPGEQESLPPEPRNYSNVGFGLLGGIVEKVAGVPFARYCQTHVFEPLAMTRTGWYLADIPAKQHVVPYSYLPSDFQVPPGMPKAAFLPRSEEQPWPPKPESQHAHCLYSFPNYPDGLIRTSAEQLAHLLIAYLNGGAYNGARILEADTVAQMLQVQNINDAYQGLAWQRIHRGDGGFLWGHGGGDPGINTALYFSPEDRIGVIVFTNSSSAPSTPMAVGVFEAARTGEV